ncbi:MAG: hypothetical protein MUC92_00170 [Fimbriimonadaceae bacterium]|jgi:hypothetical protein|nr:hypothetical protein [Fimbriimonadaceae bacterium]
MRKLLFLCVLALIGLFLAGCEAPLEKTSPTDAKDFKGSPPPADYMDKVNEARQQGATQDKGSTPGQ